MGGKRIEGARERKVGALGSPDRNNEPRYELALLDIAGNPTDADNEDDDDSDSSTSTSSSNTRFDLD